MRLLFIRLLVPVLALAAIASAFDSRPKIGIRFYLEANPMDGGSFISKVKLRHPPRDAAISTLPLITEKNIQSVFLFQATDSSWGAAFELDAQGTLRLQTVSTESRGLAIVPMVATKRGTHQVTDMIIDRPVTDGIITIMKGLSDLEAAAIRQQFPAMGADVEKARQAKEKAAAKESSKRKGSPRSDQGEQWVPE